MKLTDLSSAGEYLDKANAAVVFGRRVQVMDYDELKVAFGLVLSQLKSDQESHRKRMEFVCDLFFS